MEINDPYLTSRVEGTRLGQVAVFQCPIGFRLNGTSNLTCQASGKSHFDVVLEFYFMCLKVNLFSFRDSFKATPKMVVRAYVSVPCQHPEFYEGHESKRFGFVCS
jgi:hypothetical protein